MDVSSESSFSFRHATKERLRTSSRRIKAHDRVRKIKSKTCIPSYGVSRVKPPSVPPGYGLRGGKAYSAEDRRPLEALDLQGV